MTDKQPSRVEVLAARLRQTLDKRLGRTTPQQVIDLAKQLPRTAPLPEAEGNRDGVSIPTR